jgi:hypothetical protein
VGRRKVTFHRDAVDAMEALTGLLKAANASYVIGEGAQRGRKVSVHFNDTPLEDGLGAVAEAAGLTYHLRGNVIIFSQNPASVFFSSRPGDVFPTAVPVFKTDNRFNGGKGAFAFPGSDSTAFKIYTDGVPGLKGSKEPFLLNGPDLKVYTDRGVLLKPGVENRNTVRKRVRIQLQNVTVGNALKRMKKFARAEGKGQGVWIDRESETTARGVQVDGDPSGRTLDIEGEPGAVDAFVKAVQDLDRTGRNPKEERR